MTARLSTWAERDTAEVATITTDWLVKVRWADDGTVDTWTCQGTHLIGGSVLHLIATRERHRGTGTAVPAEVTAVMLR